MRKMSYLVGILVAVSLLLSVSPSVLPSSASELPLDHIAVTPSPVDVMAGGIQQFSAHGLFPGEQFAVGEDPRSVALGDIDGDDQLDIVTANSGSDSVSVLLGNGDGVFGTQMTYAVGSGPSSVGLGDLNGDNYLDIVTANSGSDSVSVLLGNGDGVFGTQMTYAVGSGPSSVGLGDLNGDDYLDIVTANSGSDSVSVLLGNGDGGFADQSDYATGSLPMLVSLGDLNGDSHTDLVVALGSGIIITMSASDYGPSADDSYPIISVLLGNGDGTFAPKTDFEAGDYPKCVVLGDLNNDGNLDMVTADASDGNVSTLLGNGDGSFAQETTYAVGGAHLSAALGDLNGDGQLDIAVTDAESGELKLLLGDGGGTFPNQTACSMGGGPVSVAVGDINGDSSSDVVTANAISSVTVLLGNGDGTFASQATFDVGSQPRSVALGDLNNDGFLDIVTANHQDFNVSVLLGSGDGTFAPQATFDVGGCPDSVALGDLNNDGSLDIVTAGRCWNADSSVSVLLGNGDGTFAARVTFNGHMCVALGDLNNDGFLDIVTAGTYGVSVCLGNGDGTFASTSNLTVSGYPEALALGDLNNDGFLDIVTESGEHDSVSVCLGNGDGTFASGACFDISSASPYMALGDLNSDGFLDVVTVSGGVSVLLGNGDGTLASPAIFDVGDYLDSMALGDMNSDGLLDVVATVRGGVSVLLGNGDGTFAALVTFNASSEASYVALGDLNSDGLLDIVTGKYNGNNVSVLTNRSHHDGRIVSPIRSGEIIAGDALRFAAGCTGPQELGPYGYLWDFGDGRTSTLKDPGLVSFTTPGERTVSLDVVNNQGQHDLSPDTRQITVVADPGSLPDLAVTQLNVTTNLATNQPTQIAYSVQNKGNGDLTGRSWRDALYLSRDEYLDTKDTPLTSGTVSVSLIAGGSYTNSLTVTIPTLEEGAYYLILSVDDQWEVLEQHQLNNELAAATDVVIPRLSNGVPLADRFTGNGAAYYYRVDVPAGQNLVLKLDDADNTGSNELYLRRGALPMRGTYDHRATATGSADQQITVPSPISGIWYILAYGASVPGSGDFTIEADFSSGPKVTAVTPNRYGRSAAATLNINGAGFDGATTVALVDGGGVVLPASGVEVDSYTQIMATFDLTGLALGMYTVRVSSPLGDTSDLANAFEVLPAGEAKLETNLIVPGWMGYHVPATIYVEYRNAGNTAMPAPLLLLTVTQNGNEGALLTLQSARLTGGFWTSADPEGFSHSIQILASGAIPGVLQPGESGSVPVYCAGWQQPWDFSYPPFNFSLGVLTADNTEPVDWASLKDSMMKPASISAEVWEALWTSFIAQVGTTWGDYVRMLGDNAAYLGRLGQNVVDVSQLLAFEFMQADGLSPLSTLSSTVDAAMETPGLSLVFSRSFGESISSRYELGPLGRGWSHNWQYSLQQATDGTVTVIGPGGSRRTFQPDSRPGGKYFAQPDDHGTLTSVGGGAFTLREPDGYISAFRSDGKLHYVEDTNSNRITCTYTGDRLTSLTHSSGQSLLIAYNAAGRIQSVLDSVGRQTIFTYDVANEHLLSVQDYDGRVTSYSYATGLGAVREHALTGIAYPGATHRYFTYDAEGRLSGTSRDGGAEAVAFTYDAGKVTATDALGNSSKSYFNHRGQLVKTEDALGNAVSLTFDDKYNLVRVTDPAGRSYNYVHDSRSNLTRSTDPLGYVTGFTYTVAWNRLASVTDARSSVTRYAYDSHGNLQSITYADGSQESWGYDLLGEATSWANRRGNVIAYAYDADGRITSKTYADDSHVTYTYDARGNMVSATDATGNTTFTYNASDHLTRIDYPGGRWLQFTYDAAGRRTSSLDQSGHQLDCHYDAVGRLESMTNESSQLVVRYTYDAAGNIFRKDLGNGVYTIYEYDAAGQLLHLVNHNADGTVLSRFDYTYDSRGRRISMNTSYGLWTYEYDDLGQLTHAVLASTDPTIPNQDLTYVYDALGNRISTIENGVTTEYTANNMNQYTQVGNTTYVFDADGNLIEEQSPSGTTSYTYNDENRLISVTKGSDTWQYVYDALGNRVATTENGIATNYVIDPIGLGNVVGEYDAAGNLIAHYDYGFGLLSQTDALGNAAYYTFDALGNTQQLVTAAGAISNSYAYTPFGTLLKSLETINNPFQYVGQSGVMNEGNGLNFMRARLYTERTGRFLSADPTGIRAGISLYSYTGNSPTRGVDPAGLSGSGDLGDLFELIKWFEKMFTDLNNDSREAQKGKIGHWYPDPESESGYSYKWVYPSELPPEYPEIRNDPNPRIPEFRNLPDAPTSPTNSAASKPIRPSDPNDKIGPAGYGTSGYVTPDGTFSYRIDFENEATATAPAQQVVVTDQLDSHLDWSTFQLTEIGFGDQFIVAPSDTQHFETSVPMSYNSTDFEVQIVIDLDLASGRITACFYSIDPNTGLPPTVDIGFLPPEDGTGRGMGHVSYVIDAKSGLATGTEIRNIALISFDGQPQIATNQIDPHDPSKGTDPNKECLNTIDAGAPTSQVDALPPEVNSLSFTVSWIGVDDIGGSGIASYDIYVSDNGDPFVVWISGGNSTDTQSIFDGEVGHTYAFYSSAHDNVGNIEEAPGEPDTTTTVTSQGVSLNLKAGWNMVSVPLTVSDNSVGTVFPGAAAVFTWDSLNKTYIVPTTVEPDTAYWVAVTQDGNITIIGVPVMTWTCDIKAGWNMIGSVINNASIANPNDNPDGSVQPFAYWWDPVTKSYVMTTTTIEPRKGYWVASVQDCILTVP